MIWRFVIICLLLCLTVFNLINASSFYIDDVDEDDWVDPFDLMNYDRHSKTMTGTRKERRDSWEETELHTCKDSLLKCKNYVTELHNIIKKHNSTELTPIIEITRNDRKHTSTNERCKKDPDERQSEVYLKRFVNLFINAVGLQYVTLDQDSSQKVSFTMTVSAEQLIILRKFAKDSTSMPLRRLDETWTKLMEEDPNNWFSINTKGWFNTLLSFFSTKKDFLRICVFSVPVAAFFMILRGKNIFTIVSRIVLMVFSVAFVVKYMQMYEAAEIKQYVYQKYHKDFPAECRHPSEIGWWEWLIYGYKSNIEYCQKYHEAVLIDPSFHVSPHIVLSDVMSSFFLHPAGNIATSIATFSKIILGELPFGTNYLVFAITLFLIFVIVISTIALFLGFTISLPGYKLSYGGRGQPATITDRSAETQPIQEQTATLPQSHGLSQIQWQPVINIHVGQHAAFARQESRVEEMIPPAGNANTTISNSSSPVKSDSVIPINYILNKETSVEESESSVEEIKDLSSDNMEHLEKTPSPSKSPKKIQYFEKEIGQGDGSHVRSAGNMTVLSSYEDAKSSDVISSEVVASDIPSTSKSDKEEVKNIPLNLSDASELQSKCSSDSSDDGLETSFVKL